MLEQDNNGHYRSGHGELEKITAQTKIQLQWDTLRISILRTTNQVMVRAVEVHL